MTENGKIIAVPNPQLVTPAGINAQAIFLEHGGELIVYGGNERAIIKPLGGAAIPAGCLLLAIPPEAARTVLAQLNPKPAKS